jgi:hypothetical protein
MNKTTTKKAAKKSAKPAAASRIRFTATLLWPKATSKGAFSSGGGGVSGGAGDWCFLILPKRASAKLPSRGQTTVEGTIDGLVFRATLEPDSQGGHWLKVDRKMRGALARRAERSELPEAGDVVTLEVTPVAADQEPEPRVPVDLRKALAAATPKARDVWSDITPIARRDWIHWIVSAKQAETRARRIRNACDMLGKGKRRPCCFDRSGMYSKSMSCPVPDEGPS